MDVLGQPRTMRVPNRPMPWWLGPIVVVVVVALAPVLAVALVVWAVLAVVLLLTVWVTWGRRGRYALVVYSNSPVWGKYFEEHVIPAIGNRGVVLNWSERKQWPYSLAVALFRFFAGHREFNPLVVVFRPFAWPRTFRFYGPFKAFKHGHLEQVEDMRRLALEALDDVGPVTNAV